MRDELVFVDEFGLHGRRGDHRSAPPKDVAATLTLQPLQALQTRAALNATRKHIGVRTPRLRLKQAKIEGGAVPDL